MHYVITHVAYEKILADFNMAVSTLTAKPPNLFFRHIFRLYSMLIGLPVALYICACLIVNCSPHEDNCGSMYLYTRITYSPWFDAYVVISPQEGNKCPTVKCV